MSQTVLGNKDVKKFLKALGAKIGRGKIYGKRNLVSNRGLIGLVSPDQSVSLPSLK